MLRTRSFPVLVAVALSLSLVAAACAEEEPAVTAEGGGGNEGEGTEEQGTVTIAGREATNHGSEEVAGAAETDLGLDDFYFAPTVLQGEAGQVLSVSLSNEGTASHTFTIDEQDVDVEVAAGESGQAEVTFPDSGALVFYCRFHVGGGMLGGLSVGGDLAAAAGGSGGSGETEDQGGYTGPGY